jgi:hypothetical protein
MSRTPVLIGENINYIISTALCKKVQVLKKNHNTGKIQTFHPGGGMTQRTFPWQICSQEITALYNTVPRKYPAYLGKYHGM